MSRTRPIGRHAIRAVALGVLLCLGALLPAAASAAPDVSANWAGYVAIPALAGRNFSSISGWWTAPSVSCSPGQESYSAVWVGLGGYREGSNALEQIGSEADCSRSGHAVYSAWYELIPAGPVSVHMKVTPGDTLDGSVTVRGHYVTLRLRDTTSGAHYSVTRRISALDASSAEWIVEAPSSCFAANSCRTLPLSNFGAVSFLRSSATLGGHTGWLKNYRWSDVELEMRQGGLGSGPGSWREARAHAAETVIAAMPSALSSPIGAFTVSWQEEQLQSQEGAPRPFPGLAG